MRTQLFPTARLCIDDARRRGCFMARLSRSRFTHEDARLPRLRRGRLKDGEDARDRVDISGGSRGGIRLLLAELTINFRTS